jgi:hypothetical protein
MAREVEERDVHPELYEPKNPKSPGFALPRELSTEYTYPWHTVAQARGEVPSYTYGNYAAASPANRPRERYVIRNLVGGPCAGVRHTDARGERERVHATEPMPVHDPLGHSIDMDTVQQYVYSRCRFSCGSVDFIAYVFAGAFHSEEDVLRELFDGYNPRR